MYGYGVCNKLFSHCQLKRDLGKSSSVHPRGVI